MKHLGRQKRGVISVAVVGVLAFGSVAMAQPLTLEWSETYSGYESAFAFGVAVDASSVYVSGATQSGSNPRDLVLLKYDLAGNPIWVRNWDYLGADTTSFGLCVSGSEVQVAARVGGDAATVKYDLDGVLDTTNSADGWWTYYSGQGPYVGNEEPWDVGIDASGNLYVVGFSEHGYVDSWFYVEQYNPAGVKQWHEEPFGYSAMYGMVLSGDHVFAVGLYRPDGSDSQVMVYKYDTGGNLVWQFFWDTASTWEEAMDIAVSDSDIYVTGSASPTPTYDLNAQDVLLLKLHDDGASASYVNSTTFGGPASDRGWGIDVVDGKVYVAGHTTNTAGDRDALILAYDTDLNLLWDHSWGGSGDDRVHDITVHEGTIYVAGQEGGEAIVNAYKDWKGIPAVSEWGMVAMALLVIAAGTVVLRRRRVVTVR